MTWIQGIQIDYAEANICIREPNPDAENGSLMHNARYGFVCRKKREREQGKNARKRRISRDLPNRDLVIPKQQINQTPAH